MTESKFTEDMLDDPESMDDQDIPNEQLTIELIESGAVRQLREDVLDRAKRDLENMIIRCLCSRMAWHRDLLVSCLTAERWVFGKSNGQEKWMQFDTLCDDAQLDPDEFRTLARKAMHTARIGEMEEWQQKRKRHRKRYLPMIIPRS